MNVGIIVYSQTGNTLSVAQKLKEAILAQGHTAVLERVEAENDAPNSKQPPRLTKAPDLSGYDAVLFGAPVHAFSLCLVMKLYLTQCSKLRGKPVCCFVTQHLKKPWMGGNRAIKQMHALCGDKGADNRESGVVNWTAPGRDAQIDAVVTRLVKAL
jgi:NAD(P)H dehydrogenase (quinone)